MSNILAGVGSSGVGLGGSGVGTCVEALRP